MWPGPAVDLGLEAVLPPAPVVPIAACGATSAHSTAAVADVSVSQQTVIRYFRELEGSGLIRRTLTAKGERIQINEKGFSLLRETYGTLSNVFASLSTPAILFSGVLFTGIGEGAYYVSQGSYVEQFNSKLGFSPYPGTLNLRLIEQTDLVKYLQVLSYPPIPLLGFRSDDRTYGDVLCYRVSVENAYPGAIVRSVRSLYDNSVVEIVSPLALRKEMRVKDGDVISVYFAPPK
jgi:riboflavin kinase